MSACIHHGEVNVQGYEGKSGVTRPLSKGLHQQGVKRRNIGTMTVSSMTRAVAYLQMIGYLLKCNWLAQPLQCSSDQLVHAKESAESVDLLGARGRLSRTTGGAHGAENKYMYLGLWAAQLLNRFQHC